MCFELKCVRSVDVAVSLVAGSSLNKKSQLGHCRGLCLDQGRLKMWVCGVLVAAVGIWICGVLVVWRSSRDQSDMLN